MSTKRHEANDEYKKRHEANDEDKKKGHKAKDEDKNDTRLMIKTKTTTQG